MSLNPLNELKRRLGDEDTPLRKRLCLAKNVVKCHYFPTTAKERLVAEWLQELAEKNELSSEEFRSILGWLSMVDDLTNELKAKLVQIVSKYLRRNPVQKEDLKIILIFLEDSNITMQLNTLINDYIHITITLLQYLRTDEASLFISEKILLNLIKYYRESKKKYELILKLLDEENIETIFSYLDTEIRKTVINLCEVVLFPLNKRSFYITLLKTYIRKDNVDEIIAEKGDNIQSVLKIMGTFFNFPKQRTSTDTKFLMDFIDTFVSCYHKESQLIFAFYIMVSDALSMGQNYINPTTSMSPINLGENADKVKRNLFLKMITVLLENDVDISVRLTDTFGEKISKVETKKTFLLFLQAVMMGQLKLEGKPDKTTIQIINTALKLDPMLIEQKMKEILPPIMTAKKNNSNIRESYIEMLNCLLQVLFKLSRGILFVNQILPMLQLGLESSNTEQIELRQKLQEYKDNGGDYDKVKCKIINGSDIFPVECVEMYGKLTSELMFRQNKELLTSLHQDFQEYCLPMLEHDVVNPTTIILVEVLSAILSTFLQHNKMADHTVPVNVAEEFWNSYQSFENDCLKKFGGYVLKHSDSSLTVSFLKLCLSFSQLKLLNFNYGNTKVDTPVVDSASEVFDFSLLLPCLTSDQWITLAASVKDEEAITIMDKLILTKVKATEIFSHKTDDKDEVGVTEKSHLIRQFPGNPQNLTDYYLVKTLFLNLNKNQLKQLSKQLVKLYLNNPDVALIKNDVIVNNRELLNSILVETVRNLLKHFQNTDKMIKTLNKNDFDITLFTKEDIKEYFEQMTIKDDDCTIRNCLDILKELQIHYLEEKYQLLAIFVLLALKKCCQKKIRRNVDYILQSIFELSSRSPDVYKLFPIELIFSFEDQALLDLLTLKIKVSNKFLVIKTIIESAVRRVRSENELVKTIVELLLRKHSENISNVSSIEYFSDLPFQISCIILPLIAKQKKTLTTSAYRSILADLQEKLHKAMLESFKNINFTENSGLFNVSTGNADESMVVSEGTMATLNAITAYSLTLSKYCETTDAEEIKNLVCLWSGLEFFVQNAINAIQNPLSNSQHVESSIQLLNIVLRHIKKLDTHSIFETKDKLFLQIWQSLKSKLFMVLENKQEGVDSCLEEMSVTLKFLSEHSSVECFVNNFVVDLCNLVTLKKPEKKLKDDEANKIITSLKVSKYLWANCLKANITGPKSVAMTKTMLQSCKNARLFIWQHYETEQNGVVIKNKKKRVFIAMQESEGITTVKMDDYNCELIKLYLDTLSEAILAAKKISLDYKFLDAIFELQNVVHIILGRNTANIRCDVSWQAFFKLFEGCMNVLNSLLMSREELLEDRWPCYMQCYRALVQALCERSLQSSDRIYEHKLSENAHYVEKLTQSISKRKTHISRIAAYSIADICSTIERTAPPRVIRQHLENSVVLLIQASDTAYSMSFLRRALAGCPGQTTMTNLYTMYKRYHKYVGNA